MARKSLNGTERAKVCIRYGVYPNASWQPVPCYWCGTTTGQLAWTFYPQATVGWACGWGAEFDHLVPLAKGGANTAENTVVACTFCNRSRRDRDLPRGFA